MSEETVSDPTEQTFEWDDNLEVVDSQVSESDVNDSEDVLESESVVDEPEVEAKSDEETAPEVEEDDSEYYTPEELLDASGDIDAKFDPKRVKPDSLVDKMVKNFQRGYNNKYMDVAELKKELKAELSNDMKDKESSLEAFYNRQEADRKQQDAERRQQELEEEEALLPDEEREMRQKFRRMDAENAELKERVAFQEQRMEKYNSDQSAQFIKNEVDAAAEKYGIDLDDKRTLDRVTYEIQETWAQDDRAGLPQSSITNIIKGLSDRFDAEQGEIFSKDNISEFLDSDEGKQILEAKMLERAEAVRAKKNAGGHVVSSTTKGGVHVDVAEGVPDDIDSSNIFEYLRSG